MLRLIGTLQVVAAIWILSVLGGGAATGFARGFLLAYALVAVLTAAGMFAGMVWAQRLAALLHMTGGAGIYLWIRGRIAAGRGLGLYEVLMLIASAAFMGYLMRPATPRPQTPRDSSAG
jgi:hypothetical protein